MRIAIAGMMACLILQCGCESEPEELRIVIAEASPSTAKQFDKVVTKFDVRGALGNPFNAEILDVRLEILSPSGETLTHPAFFTQNHRILLAHGRESVRNSGTSHWEARWTPTEVGVYQWNLLATNRRQTVRHAGIVNCLSSDGTGFVRVSRSDPRYFETSNDEFFYPVGHVTRSPHDTRWSPLKFPVDPHVELTADVSEDSESGSPKTARYEQWFRQMQAHGENCCTIWMAPWWLGLEWSATRPGYGGLGHYNQKHAAQLDRLFELAEQYEIRILLYTMNHGQLSTVVDREWFSSPHRASSEKLPKATPADFFRSAEAYRLEQNRLRYILARWGYSTSLMGIGLCTEVGWIDPYHGFESTEDAVVMDGVATTRHPIIPQKELVVQWFRDLSAFVRRTDIHQHIVTLQFARLEDGAEAWAGESFDVVLNNGYTGQLKSPELSKQTDVPVEGVCDGFLAWERYFHRADKPTLVAEWGGHHLHNVSSCLDTELRTGVWAMSMTELSGVTGFWWYHEIERSNLYPRFAAVSRFWSSCDRRNRDLKSDTMAVALRPVSDIGIRELPDHPSRNAIGLSNSTELFAYVYHYCANTASVPTSNSMLYPLETKAAIVLPEQLRPGRYRFEFYDPGTGVMTHKRDETVAVQAEGRRYVSIPEFRVDIAIKAFRL